MPQLDFSVVYNNFLIVLAFFVVFYLFLNFFFLRRIFQLMIIRRLFFNLSWKRKNCLLLNADEVYLCYRTALITMLLFRRLV